MNFLSQLHYARLERIGNNLLQSHYQNLGPISVSLYLDADGIVEMEDLSIIFTLH